MTENVNTPEVLLAALDFLGAQATIRWPFEQYRKNRSYTLKSIRSVDQFNSGPFALCCLDTSGADI